MCSSREAIDSDNVHARKRWLYVYYVQGVAEMAGGGRDLKTVRATNFVFFYSFEIQVFRTEILLGPPGKPGRI